jgi:hypothetical protein
MSNHFLGLVVLGALLLTPWSASGAAPQDKVEEDPPCPAEAMSTLKYNPPPASASWRRATPKRPVTEGDTQRRPRGS